MVDAEGPSGRLHNFGLSIHLHGRMHRWHTLQLVAQNLHVDDVALLYDRRARDHECPSRDLYPPICPALCRIGVCAAHEILSRP